MRVVLLLRVPIRGVHGRLRRRRVMVRVGVGVVFLLAPRLRVHGRALVHVLLAWPGRHVMVHHDAGGELRRRWSRRPAQPSVGRGGAEVGVERWRFAHIDLGRRRGLWGWWYGGRPQELMVTL